jgi:hypothetical protein
MSNPKWKEEMTTVKVNRLTYEVFNILQKRYGKKRLGDGIAAFIEDVEPNLISIAEEALGLKERLEAIYGEAESTNPSEGDTNS